MTNAKEVLEWMKFKEERERNMTNEEWFDTLTTKGKAEVIAQLSSYGGNVEAILLWLQQPYREVA